MEPHGNQYTARHRIQTREEILGEIGGEEVGPAAGGVGGILGIRIDARAFILQRGTRETHVGDDVVLCAPWSLCRCGGWFEGYWGGPGPEVGIAWDCLDGIDDGICGGDEFLALLSTTNKEWCRCKSTP